MRLAEAVIGILAEDDDADPIERGQVERCEPFAALWKDVLASLLLGRQEGAERLHIGAGELLAERRQPAFVQPDFAHEVPLAAALARPPLPDGGEGIGHVVAPVELGMDVDDPAVRGDHVGGAVGSRGAVA